MCWGIILSQEGGTESSGKINSPWMLNAVGASAGSFVTSNLHCCHRAETNSDSSPEWGVSSEFRQRCRPLTHGLTHSWLCWSWPWCPSDSGQSPCLSLPPASRPLLSVFCSGEDEQPVLSCHQGHHACQGNRGRGVGGRWIPWEVSIKDNREANLLLLVWVF